MNPAWLPAALSCAVLAGCGGAAKTGPGRDYSGRPGTTTAYFAGLWRGVTDPPPARGKRDGPGPYVMWNVRLIGEALTDRGHVAAFTETWHRGDASVRCRRSGTLKVMDSRLVLRIRENDCAKHWDELERPRVEAATKMSVTITTAAGAVRYRWLRNAAP